MQLVILAEIVKAATLLNEAERNMLTKVLLKEGTQRPVLSLQNLSLG